MRFELLIIVPPSSSGNLITVVATPLAALCASRGDQIHAGGYIGGR